MKKIYPFLLIIILGCHENVSNCTININNFLKSNKDKVFGTRKKNGFFIEFRDKGLDSIEGGYYSFFDNGYLRYYSYFVNEHTYIYKEEYDSLGNVIKTEGTPFVRKVAQLYGNTLSITIYLFSLNKLYKNVNISTSDGKVLNLNLVKDSTFSNLYFGNFSYTHLNTEKNIISYLFVSYEDICTKKVQTFKDSITLHYKPY